ncbi:MAG: hypothetical protein H0U74_15565 [Bradymonadaceae bacterium]|nr:hypothetical protein [Lujinxingiaceae bacterium]
MGFMDYFNKEKGEERKIAKLKKTATHMYVQAAERQFAIQQLRDVGTPEAIRAMLARFNENAPNTTTDAEEKEYTYHLLVELTKTSALNIPEIIIESLHKSEEKVNWRLRVLSDVLGYEEMARVVEELLAGCTTDYQRNPEKKQELILRAAEFKSDELARQVLRFLDDDNETLRFLAVDSAVAQQRDAMVEEPLKRRLVEEDSLRIVQKLAEIFADRPQWTFGADEREPLGKTLPAGYALHKDGYVYRTRK